MRPFEEILAIDSAAAFDCAALELFRFQAERCGVYREYLAEIGVDPAAVRRVDEIPMLPIEFFKWRDVYCGDTEPQIVFKEQGEILLLRFATDLEELAKVEMMPKLDGKKMNMMLAPKSKK